MRSFCQRCGVAGAVLAVLAAAAQSPAAADGQPSEKCFLWTVTGKTAKVHLLGTLHHGHPSLYPLPKEVEAAFAGSHSLAVELNAATVDRRKFDELFQTRLHYPDGQSLAGSVSRETMDLLRRVCDKHNLNVGDFERTRPWGVWVALMGHVGTLPDGWSSTLGMDKHLLKMAAEDRKAVLELESVEAALWFTDLSAELQETLLLTTLADDKAGVAFPLEELGKAWQTGDVEAVERIVIGDPVKRHPKYRGVLEKLFDARNAKMAETIEGYLEGRGAVFVAVGAGHLVGSKGIVRLLQGKGYRVTQVTRTPAVTK